MDPSELKNYFTQIKGKWKATTFREDQSVFSQGDRADTIFFILKGKVKITVISEQGKEAVVAIHGPDEFFGEGCLTGQPVRMASAIAMTECEIVPFDKAELIRILHEDPGFSEMFIEHLSGSNCSR